MLSSDTVSMRLLVACWGSICRSCRQVFWRIAETRWSILCSQCTRQVRIAVVL